LIRLPAYQTDIDNSSLRAVGERFARNGLRRLRDQASSQSRRQATGEQTSSRLLEFEPRGEKRTAHLLAGGIQFSRSSASKDLWLTNQTTLTFSKARCTPSGLALPCTALALSFCGCVVFFDFASPVSR